MSYQVLARKWRPAKFQDVIGQEPITRSLQNAIKRSRLGHAYLFTGTRGIGKTSVARLFAKAIRCDSLTPDMNPCEVCDSCREFQEQNSMNVLEIDGASNNGVDEIRDLINNVHYLPTNGQYKVYIIDEVHMLSKPAFNALLKTLEEPPAHVIFILATTEPQKLLGTVLSRCQRFDFINASVETLTDHLVNISQKEGISFEHVDLIKEIAKLGHGSFRDTLSLMDQVLSYTHDQHISEEVLSQSLGVVRRSLLEELFSALLIGDSNEAVAVVEKVYSENISLRSFLSSFLDFIFESIENIDQEGWKLKNVNLSQTLESVSFSELLWIYETIARDTSWIFESLHANQAFKIIINKLSRRREIFSIQKSDSLEPKEVKKKPKVEEKKPSALEKPVVQVAPIKDQDFSVDHFLSYVLANAPVIGASLEHAQFSSKDLSQASHLVITYPSDGKVFYEVLESEQQQARLRNLLEEFLEKKTSFEIVLDEKDETIKTNAQERKEADAKDEENRRQEILSDPVMKLAQELFNSKIDKVQLGTREERYGKKS